MTNYFINRYYHPDESSGTSLLLDLTEELSKKGFSNLVVLTSNRVSNSNTKLSKKEIINGVKVIRLRSLNTEKRKIYFRFLDYGLFLISAFLFVLLKLKKGDLVVSMSDPPLLSFFIGISCSIKGISQINWIQDVYPEIASTLSVKVPFPKTLQKLRKWSMNRSKINVLISQEMSDYFINIGIDKKTIKIIPNWVNGKSIFPIDKKENNKYKDFASNDKFVVGYSGNMGVIHDFKLLLESTKKLKDETSIEFLFIGSGNRKKEIEDFVSVNKLKNVKIHPFQKRQILNYTLNIPDVHVITLLEGVSPYAYPSKIYGAMAAGKPLIFIGEENSELFNFIEVNDIGFSVRNTDLNRLIEVIYTLQKDKELRYAQSRRSRKLFLNNFEFSVSFKKWMKIIQSIPQ